MNTEISRLKDYKNKGDFDSIMALCNQLYPDNRLLKYQDYKEILSKDQVKIYVIRVDKKISGMASLVLYQKLGGRVALIEDVVVDKNLHGKGFGTFLTKKLLEESRKFGCHFVDVNTRRDRARDFYKKLGFFEKNEKKPLYSLRYQFK